MKVELRKEFQAQEVALQRSLSKLRSELQKAQEEARENRDKTNRLQTSLANAEGTIKVCGVRVAEHHVLLSNQMNKTMQWKPSGPDSLDVFVMTEK